MPPTEVSVTTGVLEYDPPVDPMRSYRNAQIDAAARLAYAWNELASVAPIVAVLDASATALHRGHPVDHTLNSTDYERVRMLAAKRFLDAASAVLAASDELAQANNDARIAAERSSRGER